MNLIKRLNHSFLLIILTIESFIRGHQCLESISKPTTNCINKICDPFHELLYRFNCFLKPRHLFSWIFVLWLYSIRGCSGRINFISLLAIGILSSGCGRCSSGICGLSCASRSSGSSCGSYGRCAICFKCGGIHGINLL